MNTHIPGDDDLDPRLRAALKAHNPPPLPPLDAMWREIEYICFDRDEPKPQARKRSRQWAPTWLAAAAALLLGIAIGHYAPWPGDESAATAMTKAARLMPAKPGEPAAKSVSYEVANQYLGQTAALLAVLPSAASMEEQALVEPVSVHFANQAVSLLATTRNLLDSPMAADPNLNALLKDLELVLAQIATLSETRAPEELNLITAAVEQHDVMPRLQKAVLLTADATSGRAGVVRPRQ